MTEVETCVRNHPMTDSNRVWKKDTRRAAGGRWACLECKREDGRTATKKYQSNWKRLLGHKFRGPNQMIDEAAYAIYFKQEDPERVIEQYAFRIATARLRYKVSKVRPANREEVDVATSQIWEAVDRLAKDDSKKPWSYLRGKPEAQAAWERFNAALTEAGDSGEGVPRCENDPAPYTDFGGEGYDHGDDLPTSEEAYMLCAECPLLALCGNWAELERPAWGVWAGDVWVGGEVVND